MVIVVAAIVYRKRLALFFTQLIYGPYSRQFIRRYKKTFENNPFPHAAKSELWEYIQPVKKIVNAESPCCQTNEEISLFNYTPGTIIKKMEKAEGEPDYFSIREIGRFTVKIYGYDIDISGLEAIANYFIYNNIFFFGEIIIRRENQRFEKQEVIKKFNEKYGVDCKPDEDALICDSGQNRIYITDDGFSLRIKYFSKKPDGILIKLYEEQEKINEQFLRINEMY